jgi:glycogen debranching enzyme
MATDTVSILDGNTFVVSDRRGNIDASPSEPHGLFHRDTRFLSRWRLTMDGRELDALSTDDVHYFAAQFFLIPGTGTVYSDANVSVIRTRSVGQGFHEDITVLNHATERREVELRLEAAADFADLFEVKDALAKKGTTSANVEDGRVVLSYRRERMVRETWITATAPEARLDPNGLSFSLTLEPHGEWRTCVEVLAALDGLPQRHTRVKYGHGDERAMPNMEVSLEEWAEAAPWVETDWDPLRRTYERSLVDLAALRFHPLVLPERAMPAAGLPWFMTIFGRDSLITSYQVLPFAPELAETTLLVLAARQGRSDDPFRDEEPGKILHELRFGELTAFEDRPHSPYFGSADSTPLFLVLLDEYERWTGDTQLVRDLEGPARAALAWIDKYGDRDRDGYVEYERRNPETGLENQCWKDSWNSILFADGSMSSLPRACCEIQGYVYDAKMRTARLAREFWGDAALAERLEAEAAELKRRFHEDFWLGDREYFALALDGDKRRVDALTSNIGHLLWSGIVDEDKAKAVVGHLLGERLFSGWGVRTMAEGDGGYNPIGYHNGTVWPHDNSLIALGLVRYGYRKEAATVAAGLLEAAPYFDHRLPEAFAGYRRQRTSFPVEYPTACSPQAWATGAPLAFIRALLDLQPDGAASDPVLPPQIRTLRVHGAPPRPDALSRIVFGLHGAGGVGDTAPAAERHASARDFFAAVAARYAGVTASLRDARFRFEIEGTGTWLLEVADGNVSVTEGGGDADLVVRSDEDVFLAIAHHEQNPETALLSGKITAEGDVTLTVELRRLLG